MKQPLQLRLESLESRQLMTADVVAVLASNGLLSITGTSDDDTITVERRGAQIVVSGVDAVFAAIKVKAIEIQTGDGNDVVSLRTGSSAAARWVNTPVTIDAGNGSDTIRTANGPTVYFGGSDDVVNVDRKGNLSVGGQKPSWFNQNISDTALRELVRQDFADTLLNRADMLGIFDLVSQDNTVSKSEFDSLRAVVNRKSFFGSLDYVQGLSDFVVDGCVANNEYQGQPLGNLQAGSTGDQLTLLVNKWFLGLDHPNPSEPGNNHVYTYQTAAGSLFVGAPSYHDVDQGIDGDCYFLSGMTAITVFNPQIIQNMFIVNGDGTYTLRFYHGGQKFFITVDSMLPVNSSGEFVYADDGRHYTNPNNVLWVPLAEKAYAQLAAFGWLDTGSTPGNAYAALNEGNPGNVFEQITGRTAEKDNSLKSASAVIKAFAAHRPVAFVTLENPPSSQIVSDHVYAMLGYDSQTQKFELFNPWGLNNGTQYPGIVHLTWAEIQANYGDWAAGPKV